MSQQTRILLADDEDFFLRTSAQLFRQAGYFCECVRDATETMQALERQPFDALVADIHMAGNSELELVREIRTRFAELPVIIVTGRPSVATAITALRLAAVDYILKPVDFPELLGRVEEAIKARRALRSVEQHLEEFGPVVEKLQSMRRSLAKAVDDRGAHESETASDPRNETHSYPRVLLGPSAATANRPANEARIDVPGLTDQLSPREREILDAVATGQRVSTIARAFSISPYTVRNHLKAIFRKLGVHSQVELLAQIHARSRAGDSRQGPV